MQQRATVVGVKRFKGEVEGNHYDTCKVRVMMRVPPDSENECGFNVIDVRYGHSDRYESLARMNFPFDADLVFESVARNGRMENMLFEIKAVQTKQG